MPDAASGPEVPFPTAEPGVPFPMKQITDFVESLFRPVSKGPGMLPFPGLPHGGQMPSEVDGGDHSTPPPGFTAALGRAKYRAFRIGTSLFIHAEGTLSYRNQRADLRQSSHLIYPPQFEFVIYSSAIGLPALREFSFTEMFGYPEQEATCTVSDADGPHQVTIEGATATPLSMSLTDKEQSSAATNVGHGRSLQEAFDNAVAGLTAHQQGADTFLVYKIVESGSYRGGFAGLSGYFCKVTAEQATHEP